GKSVFTDTFRRPSPGKNGDRIHMPLAGEYDYSENDPSLADCSQYARLERFGVRLLGGTLPCGGSGCQQRYCLRDRFLSFWPGVISLLSTLLQRNASMITGSGAGQ